MAGGGIDNPGGIGGGSGNPSAGVLGDIQLSDGSGHFINANSIASGASYNVSTPGSGNIYVTLNAGSGGNAYYFIQNPGTDLWAIGLSNNNFAILDSSIANPYLIICVPGVGIGLNPPGNPSSLPINACDIWGGCAIGAGYAGVDTAPTNGLLVQGTVGIGTTIPANPLDVNGNATVSNANTRAAFAVGTTTADPTGLTALNYSVITADGSAGGVFIMSGGGNGAQFLYDVGSNSVYFSNLTGATPSAFKFSSGNSPGSANGDLQIDTSHNVSVNNGYLSISNMADTGNNLSNYVYWDSSQILHAGALNGINVSTFPNDAGYLTSIPLFPNGDAVVTTDNSGAAQTFVTPSSGNYFMSNGPNTGIPAWDTIDWSYLTGTPPGVSLFNNDAGYLTSVPPGGSQYDVQINNGSGGFYGDNGFTYTNGLVGIGTTAPTRSLSLDGGSGSVYMSFNESGIENIAIGCEPGIRPFIVFDDNLLAYTFVIDTTGNVGIGNAAPAFRLDVGGTGNFSGNVISPGSSGNTFTWGIDATAPATQTLLSLPLNTFGAGTITSVLGTPDDWALVNVNSTNYKIPLYLP